MARHKKKMRKTTNDDDFNPERFDYAWKWFQYHADQRVKLFNYMLVTVGVLAAGLVPAYEKVGIEWAVVLCLFASVLAVAFIALDKRNQDLLTYGEDVLAELEKQWLFSDGRWIGNRKNECVPYSILMREATIAAGIGPRPDDCTQCNKYSSLKPPWLCRVCSDAWRGKHRVWFRGIALLIIALFLIAAFLMWKAAKEKGQETDRSSNAAANLSQQ